MGNFDRPSRKRTPRQIPARLRKLDRDLFVTKRKDFEYLNLVGRGLAIRICVMRDKDDRCWATAQLGDRAFRVRGGNPSGAVVMLQIALRVHYAQQPEEKKAEIRAAHSKPAFPQEGIPTGIPRKDSHR